MPQLNAAFSGLIELAVLIVGLRIVAHMIALNCYGKDSQRWKRAAFNHVENLTDLHEVKELKKSVLQMRRQSTVNVKNIPVQHSQKITNGSSSPYLIEPEKGQESESGNKKVDINMI